MIFLLKKKFRKNFRKQKKNFKIRNRYLDNTHEITIL